MTKDEIEALTFAYLECLDDLRLAEWPEFFTEACTYRVIPRENFEAGRTLCTPTWTVENVKCLFSCANSAKLGRRGTTPGSAPAAGCV